MSAKTDLLPLPKGEGGGLVEAWSYDQMQAYARANVEHHTAALQAEVEAMRAERDALREALETMVEMVEMNGFGRAYAMDVARAALAQEQGEKHDNQD